MEVPSLLNSCPARFWEAEPAVPSLGPNRLRTRAGIIQRGKENMVLGSSPMILTTCKDPPWLQPTRQDLQWAALSNWSQKVPAPSAVFASFVCWSCQKATSTTNCHRLSDSNPVRCLVPSTPSNHPDLWVSFTLAPGQTHPGLNSGLFLIPLLALGGAETVFPREEFCSWNYRALGIGNKPKSFSLVFPFLCPLPCCEATCFFHSTS